MRSRTSRRPRTRRAGAAVTLTSVIFAIPDAPLEDPPPTPAHRPPWHVCPIWVQSSHAAPPFPQAVSSALVLQFPFVSQHPVQEGSQTPGFAAGLPGLPSSLPVPTPELSPVP
jgi:hypothetical protein